MNLYVTTLPLSEEWQLPQRAFKFTGTAEDVQFDLHFGSRSQLALAAWNVVISAEKKETCFNLPSWMGAGWSAHTRAGLLNGDQTQLQEPSLERGGGAVRGGEGGGVFHHFSIFHFSEANKWLQMNAWPKKKPKKKNRHIPKIHPNTNVLSTKYLYMWTDCSVIKSREHRTVTLQACQWIYELFSHWDYYTVWVFFFLLNPG